MTVVMIAQESSLILYLYASEGIPFSLFEKLMENNSAHAISAEKLRESYLLPSALACDAIFLCVWRLI